MLYTIHTSILVMATNVHGVDDKGESTLKAVPVAQQKNARSTSYNKQSDSEPECFSLPQ